MKVIRLSKRLWASYVRQERAKAARLAAENKLRDKRQELVVEHMHVARAIARQVYHKFRHAAGTGGSKISIEDMIAAAYVGLVEAAGRWVPAKGEFQKYCYFRVRGAVIDAHRRQAYKELLPVSLDEWIAGTADSQERDRVNERFLRDPSAGPDELVGDRQRTAVLVAVIRRVLSDAERQVIAGALDGKSVIDLAASRGEPVPIVRKTLATARDKVAAEVQRRVA